MANKYSIHATLLPLRSGQESPTILLKHIPPFSSPIIRRNPLVGLSQKALDRLAVVSPLSRPACTLHVEP